MNCERCGASAPTAGVAVRRSWPSHALNVEQICEACADRIVERFAKAKAEGYFPVYELVGYDGAKVNEWRRAA